MDWSVKTLPNELLGTCISNVISKPTAIQQCHWSNALNNSITTPPNNVTILTSPTGTGKTLSYLIPALSSLFFTRENKAVPLSPVSRSPYVIIVCPTRELVIQVFQEAEALTTSFSKNGSSHNININNDIKQDWLKSLCLYGGVPPYHQKRVLLKGCHMIIATPGRLNDLTDQNQILFDNVKYFILDEFDALLQKPIKSQVEKIIECISPCPMVMASATLPLWMSCFDHSKERPSNHLETNDTQNVRISHFQSNNVTTLSMREQCPWLAKFDSNMIHIDARPSFTISPSSQSQENRNGIISSSIQLHLHIFNPSNNEIAIELFRILTSDSNIGKVYKKIKETDGGIAGDESDSGDGKCTKTLIFLPTRIECERVAMSLKSMPDMTSFVGSLHGGISQSERFAVLRSFSTSTQRGSVLCVTDVAARGLHIDGVAQVLISPSSNGLDTLVHKIGRVGRLGNSRGNDNHAHLLVCDSKSAQIAVDLLTANQYQIPSELEQLASVIVSSENGTYSSNRKKEMKDASGIGMKMECVEEGLSEDMMTVALRAVHTSRSMKPFPTLTSSNTLSPPLHSPRPPSHGVSLNKRLLLNIINSSLQPTFAEVEIEGLKKGLYSKFLSSIQMKWCFITIGVAGDNDDVVTYNSCDGVDIKSDDGNGVTIDNSGASIGGSLDSAYLQWLDDVVELHIDTVDRTVSLLNKIMSDENTVTPLFNSDIILANEDKRKATVVVTERVQGLGGLSQLLSSLLGLLLPILLPQLHILIVAAVDKHNTHQSHIQRDVPKQREKKEEKWRSNKFSSSCSNDSPSRPMADVDCGLSCCLYKKLNMVRAQGKIHQFKSENNLKRKSCDLADSPLPDSSSLNVLQRRGGFSSGPRARTLLQDIQSISKQFHSTDQMENKSTEVEEVIILVGLDLCGLSALRACSILTLNETTISPTVATPASSSSTSASRTRTRLRTGLILNGGCFPDPSGDHLRTKSAYVLGKHTFSSFELYQNTYNSELGQSLWLSHILCGIASIVSASSINLNDSLRTGRGRSLIDTKGIRSTNDITWMHDEGSVSLSTLQSTRYAPIIEAVSKTMIKANDILSNAGSHGEYALPPTQVLLTVKEQMIDLLSQAKCLISNSIIKESPMYLDSTKSTSTISSSEKAEELVGVQLVSVSRDRFISGGYSKEHYVSSLPDVHSICYELQLVSGTGEAGRRSVEESRGNSDVYNGMGGVGVAFIAFGVSNCGDSLPWLPFQRRSKFDIAQVDRLVVLSQWRGCGAKELLLRAGGNAFHLLGLPMRIKTASELAHLSFIKMNERDGIKLKFESHRNKTKGGTGRGCKEGWVHWYVGEHVTDPLTGNKYAFI